MSTLVRKITGARRIAVLGNGGVALGLVHELKALAGAAGAGDRNRALEMLWVVRDQYIGNTFFDASASEFFLATLRGAVDVTLLKSPAAAMTHSDGKDFGVSHVNENCTAADPMNIAIPRTVVGSGGAHGAESIFSAFKSRIGTGIDSENGTAEARGGPPPLPQRVRRVDRQRQPLQCLPPPAAAVRNNAVPAAAEEPELQLPRVLQSNISASPTAHETVLSLSDSNAPTGAALGSDWALVLRAASGAAAATHDGDNVRPCAGSSDDSCTLPRLVVALGAELDALRGVGPQGAFGVLADGAWHTVTELSQFRNSWGTDEYLPSRHCDSCRPAGGDDEWPLVVRLTTGAEYGCDVVVCAMGVVPVVPPLMNANTCSMGGDAESESTGILRAVSDDPLCTEPPAPRFMMGADGGLVVNRRMQTTGDADVYAAGDAASMPFTSCELGSARPLAPPLWFQMRTWAQARTSGQFAARCMVARKSSCKADDDEEVEGGFSLELFAHVTSFQGYKVVLLGLFNGQGLGKAYEEAIRTQLVTEFGSAMATSITQSHLQVNDASSPCDGGERHSEVEIQVRVTPGVEYVKIVLWRGRVVGALLIGETDLEETMENLILNGIQVTAGGPATGSTSPRKQQLMDLLNPDVDIEDYFD